MKALSVTLLLLLLSHSLPGVEPKVALSVSESHRDQAGVWRAFLEDAAVQLVDPADSSTAVDVLLAIGEEPVADVDAGGIVVVDGASADLPRWEGEVSLFFSPEGMRHPVGSGVSNFNIASEFAWGVEPDQDARIIATTWTPDRKHLKDGQPQPYVYGVTPVLWSFETGEQRRVDVNLGGVTMLENPAIRALLTRAIAWVGRDDEALSASGDGSAELLRYPPGGPLSPTDLIGSIQAHPDFEVSLVAAEPLISKPVNIDWDSQGRMWVAETLEYPEGRRGGGAESMYSAWQIGSDLPKPPAVDRPGRDRISMLEDRDGDGVMDAKRVFATDLDLVTSFCFYRDGLIVAQPPEVLFIRDTDGDGVEDSREVLYSRLGNSDTHAVLNNLRWGLDGWIYATHGYSSSRNVISGDGRRSFGAIGSGVVRFRPDGSAFEMYSAKSGNCWGVDFTSDGEIFFTQPTSGDLVMHVPAGDRLMAEGGMGHVPSWNVMVRLRPVRPLMSWEEIVENQPNDVIGSFTAACGCALYEGGSWPDAWRLGYFTAEPTVHILHHEAIEPDGVSFSARKTREAEFSATRDPWHRPIDTRIGPDGQLYVSDFYNQAILHNDPRGPIHLWNNQAARPDRDHYFGRILRYQHKQAEKLPTADLSNLDGCIEALAHPNREVRFRAQRLIEENPRRLSEAAARLAGASGFARLHALWLRAAGGSLEAADIASALNNEDLAVRLTIARVLAEHSALVTEDVVDAIALRLEQETDARARLALLAAVPSDRPLPAPLLVELASLSDDVWTRAAIQRNAFPQSVVVLKAAIAGTSHSERVRPFVASLVTQARSDSNRLTAMLKALVAAAGEGAEVELLIEALQDLAAQEFVPAKDARNALADLLNSETPALAASALSLAARSWNADELESNLSPSVSRIVETLDRADPHHQAILRSLAQLPVIPESARGVLAANISEHVVFDTLRDNPAPDAARLLVRRMDSFATREKALALESLLSRRRSAIVLLEALNAEELPISVVGQSAMARLRDHPDEDVSRLAGAVSERMRVTLEARDAIVKRLLPSVLGGGDAANGKALYAACSVCHEYRGEGSTFAPVLDGMGAHGIEALLTHIIDPNREVEPTYHTWNITRKDGEVVTGMISRETAGSIFVRNVAGEIEVPRGDVASRVDTGRSLMPDGFEALGADGLRDLIAYLRSDAGNHQVIPFGDAATANGRRGVYLSAATDPDRVSIRQYGLVQVHGVPFSLSDPDLTINGRNVIVLRGGPVDHAISRTMPESVELNVGRVAGRLHLLGAVAGWGWPVDAEKTTIVEVVVHYHDGVTERLDLRNGIEFGDHIQVIDVPGSAHADVVERGQMRYLWRDLGRPGEMVDRVELRAFSRTAAPMIAALTMESPDASGRLAPPPAVGGPAVLQSETPLPSTAPAGKLRVLMAGGGGSHDYERHYREADGVILRESGHCVTRYTDDPNTAAEELAHADVLVLSANDARYQRSAEFRKALDAFVAGGGGLVLLRPATWYNWNDWPEYNRQYVGGGARSHDAYGKFTINVTEPDHSVTRGVSRRFEIIDELYHVDLDEADVEVLATTSPDQDGRRRPSVWVARHPAARILCIAPGHDEAARKNPDFVRLLVNGVLWVADVEHAH